MINQLDLFGTAAPSPARRPACPDTALLLAMSADHMRLPYGARLDDQGERAPLNAFHEAVK